VIATELSTTYSVAKTTAQQIPDARIEVIDTRSLAVHSLIATACARLRRSGGSFDQAVALARSSQGRSDLRVADTLEYSEASGRVTARSPLRLAPQDEADLEVANGVVHPADRVRTREKAVER